MTGIPGGDQGAAGEDSACLREYSRRGHIGNPAGVALASDASRRGEGGGREWVVVVGVVEVEGGSVSHR